MLIKLPLRLTLYSYPKLLNFHVLAILLRKSHYHTMNIFLVFYVAKIKWPASKKKRSVAVKEHKLRSEISYALAVQCEGNQLADERGSGQSVPWRMLFDEQGSSVLGSLAPADLFYSFQHPLRHLLQDGSESSRVEDPIFDTPSHSN